MRKKESVEKPLPSSYMGKYEEIPSTKCNKYINANSQTETNPTASLQLDVQAYLARKTINKEPKYLISTRNKTSTPSNSICTFQGHQVTEQLMGEIGNAMR